MAKKPAHKKHDRHPHEHGEKCGHVKIEHEGHVDYLHGGHMHHVHEDHIDEHVLSKGSSNPDDCTPEHDCESHDKKHSHGDACGHEKVPHGRHVDYLVDGHLHHAHGKHCDDHGKVKASKPAKPKKS
jgi:hypothetical protein